ncbi:MAG: ribosome biogenesis GTP-binding protein YihA/YsxC [Luteolibacter sp.]
MQIRSAEFFTSACSLSDCPGWDLPEFALIGRSNVGKSSLINHLLRRQGLAKVSGTPGKTRLINLFRVNASWALVDLPGYGYAKTSKEEKFGFLQSAGDYLQSRPNLRRVLVLIDSRHPPQRIDLEFVEWLSGVGRDFSLVFTKIDKQSAAKTSASIALFHEALSRFMTEMPETLRSSTRSHDGRGEILRLIGRELAS